MKKEIVILVLLLLLLFSKKEKKTELESGYSLSVVSNPDGTYQLAVTSDGIAQFLNVNEEKKVGTTKFKFSKVNTSPDEIPIFTVNILESDGETDFVKINANNQFL